MPKCGRPANYESDSEERPLGRVSKDEMERTISWFETAQERLLTMRSKRYLSPD
jgi:hypothetical protein